MKKVMIALAFTLAATAAHADWLFPSNTYGDPVKPSGNYATTVGLNTQTNCANPGTINGAKNCDSRNYGRDLQADGDRAFSEASAKATAEARENGATAKEAAKAGLAAGSKAKASVSGVGRNVF